MGAAARDRLTSERVNEWVTIATDSGGRQRTLTDGLSQLRRAAALAVPASTWLRDEEAAGSNPATPTQFTGQFRSWNWPVLILYSSKDGAVRALPSPPCDRMTLQG